MMIFTNEAQKWEKLPKKTMEKFIKILSPFAPHLAEEIWHKFLGHEDTIVFEPWPEYDEKFLVEENVTYAVQVNGKLRADFEISKDAGKDEVLAAAKEIEKVQKYLDAGDIKKEIFVPGKIVGFVVQ
jgi:leucyl-tRNA synthetase